VAKHGQYASPILSMHFSVRWNVALLSFLTLIHGWELRNLNHRRQRLWMKWSGRVSVRPGPASEHRCTMTKVLWRENTVAAMDRVKARLECGGTTCCHLATQTKDEATLFSPVSIPLEATSADCISFLAHGFIIPCPYRWKWFFLVFY
jgi:hypothetical protein